MKKNIGKTDMIVRLALAAVLVILYFLSFTGKLAGLIFIILAIILAVTALSRTCPLYSLLKTDTLEKKEE